MNLPKQPKEGEPVKHFASEVINWMRANTLNHVKGGRLKRSTNGTTVEIIEPKVPTVDEIAVSITHPWKVTSGISGYVNIEAGYVYGYYFTHTNPTWEDVNLSSGYLPPLSIVLAPGWEYAGGSSAISGTQYIYAVVTTAEPVEVFAESGSYATSVNITYETELGQADPEDYASGDPYGVPTIVVSSDVPSTYIPSSGAAVCIAKVVNTDGVLTITQYLTHNPTIFVPLIANPLADPN